MGEPPWWISRGTNPHRHPFRWEPRARNGGRHFLAARITPPHYHIGNFGGDLCIGNALESERVEAPSASAGFLVEFFPGAFHKRVEFRQFPLRRNARLRPAVVGPGIYAR